MPEEKGDDMRVPTWRPPFSVDMAGEVLLPGPEAHIAPTTFDTWLAGIGVSAPGPR
jgi:hypothetical protein